MMERRTPLTRRTPLKGGTARLQRTRLKRSTENRKRQVREADPYVDAMARAWGFIARSKRCAVCGTNQHVKGIT